MGRIAQILDFITVSKNGAKLSEAKVDAGGGQTLQAEHFASPGDDAQPLPDDYALLVSLPRQAGYAAAGYVDPKNDQKARPGERRIYARDTNGNTIVDMWLMSDGGLQIQNNGVTVTISPGGAVRADNDLGNFELMDTGDFVVNNVVIKPNGDISTPTKIEAPSMLVDGKELKDHTHSGVTPGSGVTGANL